MSPKLCPWVDKEFIELMNNSFHGVVKRLGYKQKEALFKKISVDFVPKDSVLAQENELPNLI